MPKTARPPKDGLYRAHPRMALRAIDSDSPGAAMPTLEGHFAVFNEWTEINSWYEGNFLESIAPGAFAKTIQEGRAGMRCLFQHGMEFVQGDKPLGQIEDVREDDTGAYYAVPLFDAPYVRELVPGLEAGVYGASFRFTVIRDEFDEEPEPSDYNPKGLPERVLKECRVPEFGPVTWGAYPTATAGLRSLTDEFIALRALRDPASLAEILERASDPDRLQALVERGRSRSKRRSARMDSEDAGTLGQMLALADQYVQEQDEDDEAEAGTVSAMADIQSGLIDLLAIEKNEVEPDEPEDGPTETNSSAPSGETRADDAPPEGAGHEATPTPGRRDQPTQEASPAAAKPKEIRMTLQEMLARREEIRTRLDDIDAEHGDAELPEEAQREYDTLQTEDRTLEQSADRIKARREERRAALARGTGVVGREDGATFNTPPGSATLSPYDIEGVRGLVASARTPEARAAVWRDQALRAIDSERTFAHPSADEAGAKKHMETLLRREAQIGVQSAVAERIVATGSELYLRAFAKRIAGAPETPEEQRALATFTGAAGGFAVPYQFDPTLIPTSNLSVNPYRAIARVEQVVSSNEWRGVTAGGVTPAYAVEGAEAIDNSPTLTQPVVNPERCQAFVPFSIELEGDWPAAMQELAMLIADGKDDVEATKFTTGLGHASNEPQGVLTGATLTVATAGTATVALADIYKLWETLPPRYRARAVWVGSLAMWDRIRQFDVYGGAQLFVQNLQMGMGGNENGPSAANIGIPFLAKAAYEVSTMATATTTGSKVLTVGDFRRFIIVDRMGMNVEIVSHLVGTNHRPTGQRGLFAIWRNSSAVLDANAFRTLVTA